MTALLNKNRITLIWLLLVAATVISWELGHGIGIDDMRVASVLVIIVAFIKVRVVAFEFMELRYAPQFMQLLANAWLLAIGVALIGLYWVGAASP